MVRMLLNRASTALVANAVIQASLARNSPYQRSEKPEGGKLRLDPGENEAMITMTTGRTRKQIVSHAVSAIE